MVKVLFAILIASFAIWGVDDMIRVVQSDAGAAVKVGDVEVAATEVAEEVRREVNRLRTTLGGDFGIDQARTLGVVESVVQRVANDTAIMVAAGRAGIAISDDLLRDAVRRQAVFQTLGSFDRNRFEQILNQNQLSEASYLQQLRKQMARNQLLDSIGLGAAAGPLVDSIYRRRQEKRVAETVFIADAAQAAIAEPDAAALAAYHKANAARFTAPEYRALTVIRLDAADLAKEIAVSDAEVREAYQAREDEFLTPEKRMVQQMIFTAEADAKRARAALGEGRAFLAVAKEIARMEPNQVELGELTRADLLPGLADAVFALEKNQPSAPVNSPLGWHVLQVTDVKPGGKKTLEQASDELRKTIAGEKAVDTLFQLANKLDDALAGGAKLEEAAGRLNMKVQKIAAIDAQGKDPADKPVADVPKGDFLATAFATEQGADSQLIETGRDGFFVLRVDGITPPALRPLEKVKTEVVAAWKADRRAEAAKTAAEAALQRLKGGTALDAVAKQFGVAVATTPPLLRQPETDVKLPQALIAQLFTVDRGEPTMARGLDGYYLARLKDIIAADPAADKAGRDALAGRLRESVENDIYLQLALALRDRYGVTINQRSIDESIGGAQSRAR